MLLIDASMVFHRCFHKLDFLMTSKGVHTGMEFGTFRIIESLQKKFPKQDIILVFDEGYERRKAIDPNYKANRSKKSSEFYLRMSNMKLILSQVYYTASKEGEEADEVIHSLVYRTGLDGPHYIYSNDNDLLQSVSDELKIQVVKSHESKLYFWDEAKIREKYGVGAGLLPIFRSFIGDGSDNIFGIPRIPRRILAEGLIYAIDRWDGENIFDYLKIFTEDNLFSDNMSKLVSEFIEDGSFVRNYQLIKLEVLDVFIEDPRNKIDLVKEYLQTLEIFSLKLCKDIGMKEIQSEEEF